MAEGVTVTGLAEYRRAVETLPASLIAKLQAAATATAARVQTHAKEILASQLKTDRHALIDAITVHEDALHHQVQVRSAPPSGQASALPLFVEYGTVKMPARPYMRPAADGEGDRYRHALELASDDVLRKALT